MGKIIRNGISYGGAVGSSSEVAYENTTVEIALSNLQNKVMYGYKPPTDDMGTDGSIYVYIVEDENIPSGDGEENIGGDIPEDQR